MDLTALADLSLTVALAAAVIALWRENQRLVNIIIDDNKKAEAQRLRTHRYLEAVLTSLGVKPPLMDVDLPEN